MACCPECRCAPRGRPASADAEWRDVVLGALITALLIDVGKWAIGEYLGRAGVASAYGAAGSVVLILLWSTTRA
jgi:membrane protein